MRLNADEMSALVAMDALKGERRDGSGDQLESCSHRAFGIGRNQLSVAPISTCGFRRPCMSTPMDSPRYLGSAIGRLNQADLVPHPSPGFQATSKLAYVYTLCDKRSGRSARSIEDNDETWARMNSTDRATGVSLGCDRWRLVVSRAVNEHPCGSLATTRHDHGGPE